jgi:hypothetical protein
LDLLMKTFLFWKYVILRPSAGCGDMFGYLVISKFLYF